MSLHAFLTRLIWLCVLPLVLLAVYLAGNHIHTLQTQRAQEANDRVDDLVIALEHNLGARIAALQVLAVSPLAADPPRLQELYKEAQGVSENFGGQVILANLSMQMLFNTKVPFGVTLPKLPEPKGYAAVPAVLATGKPSVGDTFLGPIAKEPLVAVVVPVIRSGQTIALLLNIVETKLFQNRIDQLALPAGWSLTLLDGKDEVMARRSPPGLEASPAGAAASERFVAKLTASHWSVVLEIPSAAYHKPIVMTAMALIGAILAVTLVSVLGGRLASRCLGRAVQSLTRTCAPTTLRPVITEIEVVRTMLDEAAAVKDASERRFRGLLEKVQLVAVLLDGNGKVTFCNDFLLQLTGFAREELLGCDWFDRMIPDAHPEVKELFLRGLRAGEIEPHFDNPIVTMDGTVRHIVWNNTVLLDEAGLVSGTASIGEDITQRKQAETHIHNLYRVNRVLSNINKTIVRISDLQAIFNESCRIAVEDGGFRMAWIGLLDEATGMVEPVAHNGVEEGDLEKINIVLSDDPYGRGPTASALIAGEHIVCNDIAIDPRMAPWREDALRLGFLASIALPLIVKGKTLGTFNLYAGAPGFFDEEEVRLLDELAMDISFAMEVVERDEERKRAEVRAQQNLKELTVLHALSQQISADSTLDTMIKAALGGISELIAPDLVVFFQRKGDNLELLRSGPVNASCRHEATPIHHVGECLCGLAARFGKPVYSINIHADTRCTWVECKRAGVHSFAALPLLVENQVIGVIGLASETEVDFERQSSFLEAYASEIALGMKNALLVDEVKQHAQELEQEIVERQQAEEALRDSQAYNRMLFEQSPIGLALTQMDGKLVDINAAYAKIIGRTIDETLNLTCWDITPEHYAQQEQEQLASLNTSGAYGPFEKEYIHKDGHLVPVRLQGLSLERNGEKFIWSSVEDITERKKAQETLLRRENLFRLFVEHSPAAIAMFDNSMRYIVASRRFLADYGLGDQNIIGRTHYDLFPDIPECWKEIHRRCLAGAVEKSEEDPFLRTDGKTDWVRWEIHPWYETEGKIGGIILFSEVINERKQAELELVKYRDHLEELVDGRTQELAAANERLQEVDRLKSMFIASMSHELRTPLNSVIGFSSILLNEWIGTLNDEQKQSLTSILNSGKHLLSLINDVIDVSKIEAGMIEVSHDDFDLAELLAEVKQTFAKESRDRHLMLTIQELHLTMYTDRRRVLQCLLNLVSNALKFTEEGGVTVAVRHDRGQGEVTIAVTDTGIGIETADQAQLFHAFSRIQSSLSAKVLGTGLGLYLTRKIILEILHGAINVTSEPRNGSTFVMTIPCRLVGEQKEESRAVATGGKP